jgi:type I restriction enzyme, S subunit
MIADLAAYPRMKDSGVPWLGKVPEHWEMKRAKFFFREVDDRSIAGGEELLSVSHKTGVTPRREKNITMFLAETNAGHKLCRPGDVVVNTMWAWMAALGVSRHSGLVSPSYGVYRPYGSGKFLWSYLDELLRTPAYRSEYFVQSTGITSSRLRLYPEAFLRIPFLRPPPDEQSTIVRFLDHVDQRIRRYIRAKQKLIKLLEEQKQAIIRRAVTRGLDPDVRLKPSGVEWLGDVPEHWEIVSIRRRWNVIDCKHLTVPFVDDGIPLASVRETQSFELTLESANRTSQQWYEQLIEGGRQPRLGDLVYCRNVSVGTATLVTVEDAFAMGQDVCLIRSATENPRWLNYFLRSKAMADQLALILIGSTFNRINVADIKALQVALPSRPEQDQIACHLDYELKELNAAINVCRNEQTLIHECRTRLIADVVTGKLDVRGAAATLPDEADEAERPDDTAVTDTDEEAGDGDLDAGLEEKEA